MWGGCVWSFKRGTVSIVLLFIVAVAMLFFAVLIDKYDVLGLVKMGRNVMFSLELDNRGSSIYALLNSGKDMKNMELLGNLYANEKMNIDFLIGIIKKVYGEFYQLKVRFAGQEKIFGTDIGESARGVEAEFPIPGAGRGGYIKGNVVVRS